MVGQHRSVQQRKLVENTYRTRLATRLRTLSRKHPRRGWRYMQDLLGREGWRVNHKPLRHVWREEGLKVQQIRRKKRRIGSAESGILRKQSTRKNEVWDLDFIFDRTAAGQSRCWWCWMNTRGKILRLKLTGDLDKGPPLMRN